MAVSDRFLALLRHQLDQFADCPQVRAVVVYVAQEGLEGQPDLLPVGRWPRDRRSLPAVVSGQGLPPPSPSRRWLPLRDGPLLLGALQVDGDGSPWPEALSQRLQAVALTLAAALRLDLERLQLAQELANRDEQLRTLVHQLRNPLAALRTFAQLLRRRLGGDSPHQPLVEGLLTEERALQRYVEAISALVRPEPQLPASTDPPTLLLPPQLQAAAPSPLALVLAPLLQRAAATADLQHRPWQGPEVLPHWLGDSNAVGEILANLLENAFRYSPPQAALGLHIQECAGGLELTVWDGGPAIPADERQAIFQQGVRGSRGRQQPGTGLGLALARELARRLGGELDLVIPPAAVAPQLPAEGNGFRLWLPAPNSTLAPDAAGSDQT